MTNEPVREGETVVEGIQNTEGSTLMTLADMSVVTAEVKVDETDIVNVQLGQPADVTVDALPGKIFKGHVTLVGDQALLRSTGVATSQSTTGTEEAKDFKVVVTLDDPSRRAAPRPLLHRQDHHRAQDQRALAAHPGADHARSGHRQREKQRQRAGGIDSDSSACAKPNPVQGVFVAEKDAHGKLRANFVPVTTGITGATDIEVLSGLNDGRGDRHRPLQDAARPEGRRAAEARHGQAGYCPPAAPEHRDRSELGACGTAAANAYHEAAARFACLHRRSRVQPAEDEIWDGSEQHRHRRASATDRVVRPAT